MKTVSNKRVIYITETDMKRLRPLVESMKNSRDDLRALEAELEHAHVVRPEEVPADVVTMNSKVRLRDLEDNEELTYTLVFPDQANIDEGRISVVAPVGTAMLGQRVGDEFEWQVPAGPVRLRVEEVLYQPEASGRYDL
ncbi:MAG TPA: nucleoside diphosphate kinase regulator [Verrucomicrobia bacterium]|nr:nucleoside diphosphate kinase regulator [Verrucomicrobiota bacterium]HOP97923.1 nucleoside diphosphate kinase regulator [Verrucomicrobiota bacterium]